MRMNKVDGYMEQPLLNRLFSTFITWLLQLHLMGWPAYVYGYVYGYGYGYGYCQLGV